MFNLAGFYQSVDNATVLANIATIPDTSIFVQGDDLRVPSELPNIIGEVGLVNDATFLRAQISTPSLRSIALLDIEPLVIALVFGSPPEAIMHPMNPIPIVPDEAMNFLIASDPAAAEAHYGLVWLSDGQQAPINGQIYTIRGTGSAALSAGVWVNTPIAFAQTLPAGSYQIVGMRARGTNLVAARLQFIGGRWRPGVPAVNAAGDLDNPFFRNGNLGVFGEFEHTTPPTVECLGITDSAQIFFLDIIKVA